MAVFIASPRSLGGVEEFDRDEAASEGDDGDVTLGCFLTAQGNAFEAFELADGLIDPGTATMPPLGEEGGAVFGIAAVGDDRTDAACGLLRGCSSRRSPCRSSLPWA